MKSLFAILLLLSSIVTPVLANDRPTCLEADLNTEQDAIHSACSKLLENEDLVDDERVKAHWRRSEVLYRWHSFGPSLADVENALKLQPDFAPALKRKAYVLSHSNRHEEAFLITKQLLQVAPDWTESHLTHALLAVPFLSVGERLTSLKQAVDLDGDNLLARFHYGILLDMSGNRAEAQAVWAAILAMDPAEVRKTFVFKTTQGGFDLYGMVLERRAKTAAWHKEYDKAGLDYDRLVELYPDNPNSYALRAGYYDTVGRLQDAAIDVARSLNLKPDYAPALMVRMQLNLRASKYEKVVEDFKVALRSGGESKGTLWHMHASALRRLGHFDEAYESLIAAAQRDHSLLMYFRGRAIDLGYFNSDPEAPLDEKFESALMACAVDPEC